MNDDEVTYHLTPREVWQRQADRTAYEPEAFAREGFVHCTNGEAEVLAAGNRYYTADSREYCLLTVAVGRLSAPVRYEDPEQRFPHVYGALDTAAVSRVRNVIRDADGRFLAIGASLGEG